MTGCISAIRYGGTEMQGYKLIQLAGVFALLSVMAVGGGTAGLPEMKRMTVNTYQWVTPDQFRDIYSLGPGCARSEHADGNADRLPYGGSDGRRRGRAGVFPAGLPVDAVRQPAVAALCGVAVAQGHPAGLAPVSIGLMLSGTYSIARLSILNATGAVIALATLVILLWRHVNPVIMIGAGPDLLKGNGEDQNA